MTDAAGAAVTSVHDAVAELASRVRFTLIRLTRQVRAQRVDTTLTWTQLSALWTLQTGGPMSAGDLAACERVQPPSMTKVIASLDERGLVERQPHPTDGRQVIISVTAEGAAVLESEQRYRDAWLTGRLQMLTDAERADIERVLPLMDKLAQQ